MLTVQVNQRLWPRGKKYASINNLGFGSTNSHAVLERPPATSRSMSPGTNNTLATCTKPAAKRLMSCLQMAKVSLEF